MECGRVKEERWRQRKMGTREITNMARLKEERIIKRKKD